MRGISSVELGGGEEFDLIRRFLREHSGKAARGVLVGPGDDCAVISGPRLAVSTDLAVEDVHFRRSWLKPEEIGYRAAAAALSDLAAVAAKPLGLLTSIAVVPEDTHGFAEGVMAGVAGAAAEASAALLGGDVSRSPGPALLDVVAVGSVRDPVLRRGARVGDSMWVTGRLGGAAAAVAAWTSGAEPEPEARSAFARPPLRHREAAWLAERGLLHAMIDLSDGIAGDATHVAAASGIRVVLEVTALPVHEGAGGHGTRAALDHALYGGEDFELLFTASDGAIEAVAEEFAHEFRAPLTRVGFIEAGSGAVLREVDGSLTELRGAYDHFRGRTS